MNTYVIEYEVPGASPAHPIYAHATYGAETAHGALDEFWRDHPGAEIRELRRIHVKEA